MTPTTTPALPSSVTPTIATTPEPICFLPSSARLLRSFISMPSTARAISLTSPTSRTPTRRRAVASGAPPPIASFLRASDSSRSSFLRSSISAVMRAGMSSSVVRSSAAAALRQRHRVIGVLARMAPGQRLDAAHARSHRAFAGHRDQADVAGAPAHGCRRRARPTSRARCAVLARRLPIDDHADLVAVFLAEQRTRAGLAGIVDRHQPRRDLVILQHDIVGDVLDAREFFRP